MFPKLVQLSDAQYSPEVTVEGKGYMTVDIGRNPMSVNLYWQLVDPVFSLLEMGFEYPSGRLMSCAVPLFKGEVEQSETQPVATVSGTPLFDVSSWPLSISGREVRGNHIKQEGRIRLAKFADGVSIITQNTTPFRSIAYGRALLCSFDERDELSALHIVGDFHL